MAQRKLPDARLAAFQKAIQGDSINEYGDLARLMGNYLESRIVTVSVHFGKLLISVGETNEVVGAQIVPDQQKYLKWVARDWDHFDVGRDRDRGLVLATKRAKEMGELPSSELDKIIVEKISEELNVVFGYYKVLKATFVRSFLIIHTWPLGENSGKVREKLIACESAKEMYACMDNWQLDYNGYQKSINSIFRLRHGTLDFVRCIAISTFSHSSDTSPLYFTFSDDRVHYEIKLDKERGITLTCGSSLGQVSMTHNAYVSYSVNKN
jgi:hypothetical protein